MSKISEWLDDRLCNNSCNLPDIKELIDVIAKYYKYVPNVPNCNGTYKDMTPDEVWEYVYDFLGVPYNNVNDAEVAFDEMFDKMVKSTYAYEFIKNEMKK